jgi:hypothetical protein
VTLNIEALYQKALSLSADVEDTFLDLGRYLRQLLDRDPELFQKIVHQTNLGRRKAYYLVEISRVFDSLQVSRARLKKLGWTKLSLIAKQVTQANVEEWLERAENLSTKQLERKMKGKTPIKNAACVLMYFSPKEYEELAEALAKYGATPTERGIQNREEALMRMVGRLNDLEKGNPPSIKK